MKNRGSWQRCTTKSRGSVAVPGRGVPREEAPRALALGVGAVHVEGVTARATPTTVGTAVGTVVRPTSSPASFCIIH